MEKTKKRKQAKLLRTMRKIHRYTGVLLFVFFFIIAVTGFLLGWKQQFKGAILPETQKGTSSNLKEWLPLDSLHKKACFYLTKHVSDSISKEIKKIDIRKEKGMAKFIFENHYYGVQVDGKTGNLLQIAHRNSDLIESLHDGSILDKVFKTEHKQFELIYTFVMSTSLAMFTITGFWLWYGPKRMKRKKTINYQEK